MSRQSLDRFEKNRTDFMRQFVALDEIWIRHSTSDKITIEALGEGGGSVAEMSKSNRFFQCRRETFD